ncbi:hypothetical protein Pint_14089 [Pistacia integerrima]|uniref:Uncharacterized protein n=1 Tax=Pistacia integerrima TaxID=434235 RepID=A0ACC0Y7P7_9ROSI|nr:hypothetical protein Pint_14089 [Pistacia integerrima]
MNFHYSVYMDKKKARIKKASHLGTNQIAQSAHKGLQQKSLKTPTTFKKIQQKLQSPTSRKTKTHHSKTPAKHTPRTRKQAAPPGKNGNSNKEGFVTKSMTCNLGQPHALLNTKGPAT